MLTPYDPVAGQAITPTELGLQLSAMPAQRPAHRGNVDLQRIVADKNAGPDAPYQFVLGDELSCRLDENYGNFESTAAERDGRAMQPNFSPR